MRRIPRPSRAIDPAHPLSLYACQRVSPLSRSHALTPYTCSQATSAAFSTSPSHSFLLPGGKQDKKKHQQFVRRWQKRLLGESEPIGAHVDPYDPTSPVRIAPEEQGEYEEVLEEDRAAAELPPAYGPAERSEGLLRVGGEPWLKQRLEREMAKEFEKLTLRTYTPLTLGMANEIEELTGTPYTLRDENLMMAQNTHEVTARPYTEYNFGMHKRVTSPSELRGRFVQAVSEIYTLKQAGLDMDMSKFANRGVYHPPRWIKDIRFSRTDNGSLALAFPKHKNAAQLLKAMQTAPDWEAMLEEEEDPLVEEATDLQEPVLPLETPPTMDPNTPSFKKTAVVKLDGDKKPFDFMSNRPVPRTTPTQEPKLEDMSETQETVQIESRPLSTLLAELTSAVESSQSAIRELHHSFSEYRSHRSADDVRTSSNLPPQDSSSAAVLHAADSTWRKVGIDSVPLKFALFKRLFQVTGIRISDPHISSTDTLGDLYGHLCAAAKPQPTSLFSTLHVEGQKARERAKQQDAMSKRRADLGDLINLGNVELRRVKPTKTEKRAKTGQDKVVDYALRERGLSNHRRSAKPQHRAKRPLVLEGTRDVPEFGKPVSSAVAAFLSKETRSLKSK